MKRATRNILLQLVIFIFIFLFVYTAASKLRDLSSFAAVLGRLPLSGGISGVLAWIIPGTELAVSALLLVPATRRLGLIASLSLMTLFTVFVGLLLAFASHLPCSCGGVIQQLSWRQHLVFNLIFTALALSGLVMYRNNPSPIESKPQRPARNELR